MDPALLHALTGQYLITPMAERHRRAVVSIFNHYVQNSFAAYFDAPFGNEFFDLLLEMCRADGALVAETASGEVVGFALVRAFHPAPAFKQTAEISYFLSPAHTRKGLGTLLLDHIIRMARSQGVTCLVASVSSRNRESLAFHERNGFTECGHLREVGIKFGERFGVVWFQRHL